MVELAISVEGTNESGQHGTWFLERFFGHSEGWILVELSRNVADESSIQPSTERFSIHHSAQGVRKSSGILRNKTGDGQICLDRSIALLRGDQ